MATDKETTLMLQVSGLSNWMGEQLKSFGSLPDWLMVFLLCLLVSLLTEVTSNSATCSLLMPIMAGMVSSLQHIYTHAHTPHHHHYYDHKNNGDYYDDCIFFLLGSKYWQKPFVSDVSCGNINIVRVHAASCWSAECHSLQFWEDQGYRYGKKIQYLLAIAK